MLAWFDKGAAVAMRDNSPLLDRLSKVIEEASNGAIDDFELGCSKAMARAAARAVMKEIAGIFRPPPFSARIAPRGQPITSQEIDEALGKFYPHE
jgi:hypothetical protein